MIIDFDEQINLRIKRDELKHIDKVVKKNRELFFNRSHFIRCAIIRYLRDFDEKGNKKRK